MYLASQSCMSRLLNQTLYSPLPPTLNPICVKYYIFQSFGVSTLYVLKASQTSLFSSKFKLSMLFLRKQGHLSPKNLEVEHANLKSADYDDKFT